PWDCNTTVTMEIDAPTFKSLNKPQRRALLLRDQLRYLDVHHIDDFIESLANPEPPSYKRINGTIYPPLTMVTLKDTATRFDLGNVHFDNDVSLGTGIFRAYLTVEDGRFEFRTDDALPQDAANLSSAPIHVFIAKSMVKLFEEKFKAIWARRNQINEIRQVAFNMCSQQSVQEFQEGEVCLLTFIKRSRKRRPNEAVTKHASNKRSHIGLDTIPDIAKIATFNTIPDTIKIDFFNNVINTAFPNFDNLMMASWNVVSVYSNVGTDFPELHKSIVELKSVLQDFEQGFGGKVSRSEPKVRRDFAPQGQNGGHGGGAGGFDDAEHRRLGHDGDPDGGGSEGTTPGSNAARTLQQQDEMDSLFTGPETEAEPGVADAEQEQEHDMPPPRTLQFTQRPTSDDEEDCSRTMSKVQCRSSSVLTRHTPEHLSREPSIESRLLEQPQSQTQSQARMTPDLKRRRTSLGTVDASKKPKHAPAPPTPSSISVPKPYATTAELRAAYAERRKKLMDTFGENKNVPQQYRVQMQTMMLEIRAREKTEAEQRE
ncbi:hypothetical protein EK21DRAFT_20333, partial [Setomelanomma holmii]